MCCFSGPVTSVTSTHIFARSAGAGRQFLVYAMSVAASTDLAMILPLPVPPSPPDDAVRFIDLHGYASFFEDLARAWPQEESESGDLDFEVDDTMPGAKRLKVHDVGDFEASFVPRLADFDRVDARFRLPEQVWDQLPDHADFGFAVFKLRGDTSGRAREIHPMAFEFPVRDPSSLFFPTVHVHDGAVHPDAEFDHVLYFQGDFPEHGQARDGDGPGHETSPRPAGEAVDVTRAAGVIDPHAPLRVLLKYGTEPNRDTILTPRRRAE